MPLLIKILLAGLASYLIGSIPTAFIIGKFAKGIDIRRFGSGNIGATNAFRVLGKGLGITVLVIDIFKGVLAAALVSTLFGLEEPMAYVGLGIIAVAGHNWTVFLQFKGGKGIATSLGVLIGLTIKIVEIRPVLISSVLSWLAVFLLTGFVSLASIAASTLLPLYMLLFGESFEFVLMGVVFCVFVVVRHRSNIKRLLAGEERRVKFSFQKNK